ncbi:MAG: hypothetical protein ACT4PZ_11890 [Panacagrimonas sp.]
MPVATHRCFRWSAALVLAAGWCATPLMAQDLDADEIAVFDGESRLDYPGSPALDLSSPATVEFWVAPAWNEAPAYDPCVLASVGEAGLIFSVHITADRKRIGVFDGRSFVTLPFDFTDGLMHRVVLMAVAPEVTEVEIDGDTIGLLALGLGDGSPSAAFHIGSLDGEQAPFVGALARLRVWDAVLDDSTSADQLRAQTLFSQESLALAVYVPLADSLPAAPDDGAVEPAVAPAQPTARRALRPSTESAPAATP